MTAFTLKSIGSSVNSSKKFSTLTPKSATCSQRTNKCTYDSFSFAQKEHFSEVIIFHLAKCTLVISPLCNSLYWKLLYLVKFVFFLISENVLINSIYVQFSLCSISLVYLQGYFPCTSVCHILLLAHSPFPEFP